jgi:tripartite-type tricarboxylate transporter receptor subunit TctC
MIIAATIVLSAPRSGQSQEYPDRSVRILTGLLVGTSGDVAGRMLANKLTTQMRQTFVFENRPGANGQVAARAFRQSPPDGYNLFFTASSTMVTTPLINASVGFDVFKDFSPITQVVAAPLFLLVNSQLGISTVEELIQYAKKNPGKLNYGSVGRGSVFHFQGEAMKVAAGIDMVHVPYSANMSQIMTDLMENRLQVFFPAYPAVPAALATVKVKLVSVFADRRLQLHPDLPAVREAIPRLTIVPSWFGLFGPNGLNTTLAARIGAEVRTAVEDPEIARRLNEIGMIPLASTPTEMEQQLIRQIREMKQLADKVGIQPQ